MAKTPAKPPKSPRTAAGSVQNERGTRTSMKGRITPALAQAIQGHAAAGMAASEIARAVTSAFSLSPPLSHTSVTRFLARAPTPSAPAPPAALPGSLPTVSAEDLDAASLVRSQIVALTKSAGLLAEQGQASAYLRSIQVLAGLTKQLTDIERKAGSGKKVADGLGGILLEAAREDAHRCASSPVQWLLDEVPRAVRQIRSVVDALQRIGPEDRDRHAKALLTELDRLR